MQEMKIWDGRVVPRIGLGCWAIGGPARGSGSYGDVDDNQSRAALRLGYDMGARVFDTAPGYGAGHSEYLVGEEISGFEDAVIVTKFGYTVDYETRTKGPNDLSEAGLRAAIDGDRQRLKRDRIDLVLLHLNDLDIESAKGAFDVMALLRAEGKVANFGWSTDFVERAAAVADRDGFVAIEHDYNVFTPATDLMALCADKHLISISRLPLAMGLLTGKYKSGMTVAANDVRAKAFDWLRFFKDGKPSDDYLKRLDALQALLRTGGRSLAQGALGWILARAPHALPVPGFRNSDQVKDNLGALDKGPLPASAMADIDRVLKSFEAN